MAQEAWLATKSTSLSERHQKILSFIQDYQRKHHCQPSVQQIQQTCGITSPAVVNYYLDYLNQNGYI